jgi:hypothetical protein
MLENFHQSGRAAVIIGGQWGLEGTSGAAAFAAMHLAERNQVFDLVTIDAGVKPVRTSVHHGRMRAVQYLPMYPLIYAAERRFNANPHCTIYLNAGSVIDPAALLREIADHRLSFHDIAIHPNAAIITDECRALEAQSTSPQSELGLAGLGADVALSKKIRHAGMMAKNCGELADYVQRIDLSRHLSRGSSVLVEVPDGYSRSIDGPFYPHCAARNHTVAAALADAGIHPSFLGQTVLVIHTYPAQPNPTRRSYMKEGCYPDQCPLSWSELGIKVDSFKAREQSVFSFSHRQLIDALTELRPDIVHVTGCEYMAQTGMDPAEIRLAIAAAAREACLPTPVIQWQYGPTTRDVFDQPINEGHSKNAAKS